ncbi:DUF397 domain-containing protein (plasmid) [Streptomyces sp. BI20]|uniref:DUF397 domain-containing protein n=1 Tax=Streptomyces sp. BI20 TaxID=3403460 RepID=UPI003C7822AB
MTLDLRWIKSSHSQGGGACLEVSGDLLASGTVPVRDSKVVGGAVVLVSVGAFGAFVRGVRRRG